VSASGASTSGGHRYGLVLLLAIATVLDVILAPDTPVSRGLGLLLQGGTVLAVIATSREDRAMRTVAGGGAAAVLLVLAAGIATSVLARWVGSLAGAVTVGAVLIVLVRGVAWLIRDRGVTLQAVAGALAIYILVGLAFAIAINLIAYAGPKYFAQPGHGALGEGTHFSLSEETYFSFTTMTTTGYGDLTPATSVGHALAVLEMLIGQIYLVTIIGLLIGNLNRRSSQSPDSGR
jgi:voltage-gated potassium channel Kch